MTSSGRVVTFFAIDLIPGRPLRLWGAVVETGDAAGGGTKSIEGTGGTEPGAGAFIRLGLLGANDGWSASQLLAVAQARFAAEFARTGAPEVEAIIRCLERAAMVYREALDDEPALPVLALLQEALPLPARATPELAAMLQMQNITNTASTGTITAVNYAGDEGGIICHLEIPANENAVYVSITHLCFDPRVPVAREITAYQKHRVKHLKRRAS